MRAVRFGLRIEFSLAIVPVTPRRRGSGQPRKRATGRAISGPRTKTPMKIIGMARPSRPGLPARPTPSSTAPRPVSTRPQINRARELRRRSKATSCIAATGGTRDAWIAGRTADSTVIATPTISDTMIVRGRRTRPFDGMSTPRRDRNHSRALDVRTPSTMPMTDATSPTTMDSTTSDRMIWRRLAPTARSSAFSRCRWATMIENVL